MTRKIVYSIMTSLDGYIEDASGNFDFLAPDEELHHYANELEKAVDTHIYGRNMYEIMHAGWSISYDDVPNTPQEVLDYATLWKKIQKVVFSTTLDHVEGKARLLRGNIPAEVARLKAETGGDISISGAGIAASFLELGLVDEICFFVFPILLGDGKPALPKHLSRMSLELTETRTFQSGVVMLWYKIRS